MKPKQGCVLLPPSVSFLLFTRLLLFFVLVVSCDLHLPARILHDDMLHASSILNSPFRRHCPMRLNWDVRIANVQKRARQKSPSYLFCILLLPAAWQQQYLHQPHQEQ